jgi:8-oxo-dGTP pyrophosphatase MutT (NUDIX family)
VPPDGYDARFVGALRARLRGRLPGWRVQAAFAPELAYGRHFGPPAPNVRPAAVVVVLYPAADGWWLPLTLRPITLATHAGQMSLPGGTLMAGETSQAAALRELEEELAIPPDRVEVLGALSPLNVFATNFHVTPWLAVARERPVMSPNPQEVAAILEAPLADLAREECHGFHERTFRGLRYRVPHLVWREQVIWGATGMILGELLAIAAELEAG